MTLGGAVDVADVEDERTVGTAQVLLSLPAQRTQRLDVRLHLLPREAQRATVDALVAAHVVKVHVTKMHINGTIHTHIHPCKACYFVASSSRNVTRSPEQLFVVFHLFAAQVAAQLLSRHHHVVRVLQMTHHVEPAAHRRLVRALPA